MLSPTKALVTSRRLERFSHYAIASLTLFLALPGPVQAAFVQATANAVGREAWISPQPVPSTQTQTQDLNTPGTANASLSGSTFAASASASADFGSVQVSVSGSGVFPDTQGTLASGAGLPNATATFSDTFTVNETNAASGFGIMHVLLDVHSQTACTGDTCQASADFRIAPNLTSFLLYNFAQNQSGGIPAQTRISGGSFGDTRGTGALNGLFPIDIPFQYGRPFDLQFWVQAQALAGGNSTVSPENAGSGFASSTFAVFWAGITSVTDANGNPINFTVSSASGTNYLGSFAPVTVPLPPALWLLASALAGMGLIGRREQKAGSAR